LVGRDKRKIDSVLFALDIPSLLFRGFLSNAQLPLDLSTNQWPDPYGICNEPIHDALIEVVAAEVCITIR